MDVKRSRPLVGSAYGVALLMLVVAAADVFSRMLPVRLDETPWRLGAVGVLTLSLPTLLLALLVATLTAWYLEHRLVLRALALLCAAGGVILLATLPFFALDVLEMRRLVQPEGRGSFHLTMGRAALTVLLTAGVLGWIGHAGWRASQARVAGRGSAKAQSEKDRAGGMLVGRQS